MEKGKNKKVIGLMKDKLRGNFFFETRAKTFSNLKDDASENKKSKGTKVSLMKRKLKFENSKSCLEATELDNKVNYLEKK